MNQVSLNQTLLLVSDDSEVIQFLLKINKDDHFCFDIKIISSSEIELDTLLGDNPVILDMDIPKIKDAVCIDGRRKPGAPIVILKRKYEINEMRSYFKSAALDCVCKPLTADAACSVLQELKKAVLEAKLNEEIKNESSKTMPALRVSFAYNLLYGNIQNFEEVVGWCQLLGLSSIPNATFVFQIDDFVKFSKNQSKQFQDAIRNKIILLARKYIVNKLGEILTIGIAKDQFVIMLPLPRQKNSRDYKTFAKQLALEVKEYVKKNSENTITIGIGNCCENILKLYESFEEALYAHKYKFFFGKDMIFHIDDLEPFSNEVVLLPDQDVMFIANKIRAADFQGIHESIELLLERMFTSKKADPGIYKLQILELSASLARSAIHGGANPKEIYSLHLANASDLVSIENITQMKQWVRNLIQCFVDIACRSNKEHEPNLISVQKALDFIEIHNHTPITLKEVSKHVHLSTNYFCSQFKNVTGMTFIEYITHLRIEKSKKMLLDLNYSIYQIALKVGFNDPRYYSRVFKTKEGKTPKDYRNSMLVKMNVQLKKDS